MDSFFGIGLFELVLIAIIALVVMGPERLPGAMRELAKYMRQLREISGEFQSQFSEELQLLDEINPKNIINDAIKPPPAKPTPPPARKPLARAAGTTAPAAKPAAPSASAPAPVTPQNEPSILPPSLATANSVEAGQNGAGVQAVDPEVSQPDNAADTPAAEAAQ
jgi:sec-independent protein translocase protein TatB